ncbi:hypothetical protein JOD57_000679 [Geodermatophilus bullaregiensis]|uniref:hypothetical protein n=1 Tax=Geodermatophilus bullaregiensis TaxID=1564160 RepID=UPI001958DDC5|nr:hypothetical protein [Geodermatophilus bullaregiensis]MBM7804842.1 hypothetical protein [Geodermatophilus bullaregiensis]
MSEGTDWLDQARRVVAGLGQTWSEAWTEVREQAGDPGGAAGHVPGGDCRWCPVCQLAAVARRPEVSAALADALTTAAAALRAVADEAPRAADPVEPGPPDDGVPPAPTPTPPPVQHIEIG